MSCPQFPSLWMIPGPRAPPGLPSFPVGNSEHFLWHNEIKGFVPKKSWPKFSSRADIQEQTDCRTGGSCWTGAEKPSPYY